jgi:xanthine dehydrogenase accessory factor
MSILAAPLPAAQNQEYARAASYYRHLHQLVQQGRGCTEAILTQEKPGAAVGSRYLLDPDGRVLDQLAAAAPPAEVTTHLQPLSKRPRAYHQGGVAFIPVLPRITLLIVGGGHVGHAVARLARDVDFDVWVLDDRAAYANAERFPDARCIVGDIGQQLQELGKNDITPSVYALIVTRGHSHDEEALFHLATTPAGYVGLIGSKRKIKLIFEDLRARGVPRELLKRVHAPLGLDIGSQTVMEIAVSIVAELIAVRNRGQTIAAARDWVDV